MALRLFGDGRIEPIVEINADSPTDVPLTLVGAEDQTANLLEIKDDTGTVVAEIDPDGDLIVAGDIEFNGNDLAEELSLKSPSASPTFTGVVTADNYDINVTTLGSDSIALNFSAETGFYTRAAAGTITFTASNYRAGSIKTVRIIPGASNRTLNFPTNWVFVGPKPTLSSANKTGILTVTSFGTTEADCVAAWAEEF